MTTLELFKKHRKGEVSRERFLYEVRRDNNLPWVTNNTSYDDAVKILKNKGIIREAQFEPQNIATDPVVDRVNPYALKREVQKLLAKEKVLTNDSYKEALNKAARKLTTPQEVKNAMFANAETVEKADAKLQTQEVKKANHVDKHNGMKKMKGQQAPKATSAPTKENRKTKKPKGVEIMKDKGFEGSEKIIKEVSEYLKKKLRIEENSLYHEFHKGMQVETAEGPGVVQEIVGGTLEVKLSDGRVIDEQMNTVRQRMESVKEQHEEESGLHQKDEQGLDTMKEDQTQPDYYINVSAMDAPIAIEVYRGLNVIPREAVKMDGTNSYVIDDLKIAQELLNAFEEEDIKVIDTDVPNEEDDNFGDELYEATPFEQNPFDKTVDEILDTIQGSQILDDRFKELAAKVLDSILELVQAGSFERALFMLKKLQKSIEDRHMNSRSDSQEYAVNYKSYFETLENFLNAELGSDEDLEESASSKFKNGDKVKIKGEMSRHRGSTGEIHDIHEDGTALVILDGPGNPAVTVKLSDLRKDEDLEELEKVVDKNTGKNMGIFRDKSKAQNFINSQSQDVKSDLKVG